MKKTMYEDHDLENYSKSMIAQANRLVLKKKAIF